MARAAEMQSEMRIGWSREHAAARMHARMHARVDDGLKKLSWCACWLGAAWPGAAALLSRGGDFYNSRPCLLLLIPKFLIQFSMRPPSRPPLLPPRAGRRPMRCWKG